MTHVERAAKFKARHGRPPAHTSTSLPQNSGARTLLEWEPCAFEGDVIETCHSCRQGSRDVRECEKHHTITTRTYVSHRARACERCDDYRMPPGAVVRYDESNFYPNLPGWRFNTSCANFGGRNYLAWRDGWAGSSIWISRADVRWRPEGEPHKLDLFHSEANYGREDPQLFVFAGKLHVAYVGVVGHNGRVRKTSVLYARLSDALEVEQIFAPRVPGSDGRRWEKNWGFFESSGVLCAVYTIRPHKILILDGEAATWGYQSDGPEWTGGEAHGGAPPVKVGNEWWSFFHDSIHSGGKKTYRMGLYAFSAEHPFAATRSIPEPILVADKDTNTHGNYCDCVFPRGAILKDDVWTIALGEHDRFFTVRTFDHKNLERRLK